MLRKRLILYYLGILLAILGAYLDGFDPNNVFNRGVDIKGFAINLGLTFVPAVLSIVFIKKETFYIIWSITFIWSGIVFLLYFLD